MTGHRTRVLVVDASPLSAGIAAGLLQQDAAVELLGVHHDLATLGAAVRRHAPDVVSLAISESASPELAALGALMAESPLPVLALLPEGRAELRDRALEAGALDICWVPPHIERSHETHERLRRMVRLLGGVPIVRRRGTIDTPPSNARQASRPESSTLPRMIGIVASTGGPSALATVLSCLPRDLPASIVIVQHLGDDMPARFASWLDRLCAIDVGVAHHDEPLLPGHAYVAPGGSHLVVTQGARAELHAEPSQSGHRPSGDRLLTSLARSWGRRSMGIILTGMGSDGAAGLAAIKEAGGSTISQDRATSTVWGMPRVAAEQGSADHVLALDEIGDHIVAACGFSAHVETRP